jgi:hypothetical protein
LLGLGTVGNGAWRVNFDNAAQAFALLCIVAQFGFNADDPTIRTQVAGAFMLWEMF